MGSGTIRAVLGLRLGARPEFRLRARAKVRPTVGTGLGLGLGLGILQIGVIDVGMILGSEAAG